MTWARWASTSSSRASSATSPEGPSPYRRTDIKGNDRIHVNEQIRSLRVRVIDENGQLGVMSSTEALRLARDRGLDLIEIVPNSTPPVCKIMDFGKFKYEQTKKDKIQRKSQHVTQLKELRFHPNTDVHDFEFKTRHAIEFLGEGHKVKATVVFKGREITYKERGREVLERLAERLVEVAKVDQAPKLEGRMMVMIFAPDRSGKKRPGAKEAAAGEAAGAEVVAKVAKAVKSPRAASKPKDTGGATAAAKAAPKE